MPTTARPATGKGSAAATRPPKINTQEHQRDRRRDELRSLQVLLGLIRDGTKHLACAADADRDGRRAPGEMLRDRLHLLAYLVLVSWDEAEHDGSTESQPERS